MQNRRVPIWRSRNWGLRLQPYFVRNWIILSLVTASAVSIVIAVMLSKYGHRPPVGVYVGLMGLVVALMALRKDPDRPEKSLWIILITILICAEIQNLYKTGDEQNATFARISGSLDTTNQDLQSTSSDLKKTSDNIKTLLSQSTGGDTYCYLDLTSMLTPEVFVEGKYPLHGVDMEIRDSKAMQWTANELPKIMHRPPNIDEILATDVHVKLGDLAPYHGEPLDPIPSILQKTHETDLYVFFMAYNGFWEEEICLRRATNNTPGGDLLAETILVKRGAKAIFHHVDANYPKTEVCR